MNDAFLLTLLAQKSHQAFSRKYPQAYNKLLTKENMKKKDLINFDQDELASTEPLSVIEQYVICIDSRCGFLFYIMITGFVRTRFIILIHHN